MRRAPQHTNRHRDENKSVVTLYFETIVISEFGEFVCSSYGKSYTTALSTLYVGVLSDDDEDGSRDSFNVFPTFTSSS